MASVPAGAPQGRTAMIVAGAGAAALALGAAGALLLAGRSTDTPGVTSGDAAATAAAPAAVSPWSPAQVTDLLAAIRGSAAQGLRPADYTPDALQAAVDAGRSGAALDTLAESAAASLAHDYAAGRIRNRHRFNWYVDHTGPDAAALAAQLTAAREKGELVAWLNGLLPTSADYAALRDALAATPVEDTGSRDRIKVNMERWRWLPRDFGRGDQLYVNLPTYRIELRHDGETVAGYNAVIGATDMPTPVLSAPVRQVIANPDWIVPASIVRKSHLRPGGRYEFSTRPDGSVRVRQKPGPGNALGKVKIEFPNKLAIYFHDTPSRGLFGASARAFSHGCVRVQHIEALAGSIVRDPARLETALAGAKTRSFATARPLRANIVYLTLVPRSDGGLADVGDPYRMDAKLAAALDPGARRARAEVPPSVAPPVTVVPAPVPPVTVARAPAVAAPPRPAPPRERAVDTPAVAAVPKLPDPSVAVIEAPLETPVGNGQ